ncbi:MAG: 16S rRNA processing protein RimM [Deltaproteobacteria bacterium]|nr:16S rRNA processing protein RimM [Deltaproteobacteria bacterium]MBW2176687.1 16S rRNA processing protein RimM [Deltaproteobacteria bacterium]MBW2298007.1 16S rRNA processing protein RimM [Deltaproteobacteria bacterium]MBW2613126.1 16S rRNA processing protein RimM [Deltaproteobacteria bacterium]
MGKIVGAHGIKGTVKVFSYAESVSSFKPGSPVFVEVGGLEKTFTIEWVKSHHKTILMAFEGISSRDQAKELMGLELFMVRNLLEKPEAGVYYWSDIIGLSVFTVENEYLGRVVSIMQTGSNDVYVVKNTEGKAPAEILVPALEWVVREIDVDRKLMRVDLPEGLRDL